MSSSLSHISYRCAFILSGVCQTVYLRSSLPVASSPYCGDAGLLLASKDSTAGNNADNIHTFVGHASTWVGGGEGFMCEL
jgi:hypothetical protein